MRFVTFTKRGWSHVLYCSKSLVTGGYSDATVIFTDIETKEQSVVTLDCRNIWQLSADNRNGVFVATGVNERFYTLADYKEFFRQAALPMEVRRVNLSRGFKYYVNKVVNGLTHARYAFVGIKRSPAANRK